MCKRHLLLSIFFLFVGVSASQGTQISISPVTPVTCKGPQTKQFGSVSVTSLGENGGKVSFVFTISSGVCKSNQKTYLDIDPNHSFYLVNRQYSPDFDWSYQQLTNTSIEAIATFKPDVFFAEFTTRDVNMSYYPDKSTLHYEWDVSFQRDLVTNKITATVKEIKTK